MCGFGQVHRGEAYGFGGVWRVACGGDGGAALRQVPGWVGWVGGAERRTQGTRAVERPNHRHPIQTQQQQTTRIAHSLIDNITSHHT